jgi:hypothetical protein
MVRLLLSAAASTQLCSNNGYQPLHLAVMWGHEEAARQLLQHEPRLALEVVGGVVPGLPQRSWSHWMYGWLCEGQDAAIGGTFRYLTRVLR